VENLHKLREADKSVKVDRVNRKAAAEFHSTGTEELEKALSGHGRKLLREQLEQMDEYVVKVLTALDGQPTSYSVTRRRRPMQVHEAFSVFHRTRTVAVEFHLLDGVARLRCSCMFSRMMGLPCRHMCAINKGASIEDVALRWLNAVARGELDELLFDFRSRPKTYPGAVQSEAALQWYVNPLQFHSTTITPSCNDTTATPQSHNPTILQSNNLAISQPCNLTILQRGEAS
jgi:hypothetical protein